MAIVYRINPTLELDTVIALYRASTLAERRPVDDRERFRKMVENANLNVAAFDDAADGRLVGLARSVTDFAYCTYLSDLCVDAAYQRRGVGRELIKQTQQQAPQASVTLRSAPQAVAFYRRLGMTPHNAAFVLRPGEALG